MHEPWLVAAFLRELPEPVAEQWSLDPALGPTLVGLWTSAERAWPHLELQADGFAAHVARRVGLLPLDVIQTVDAPGLALAFSCSRGSEAAAVAFLALHGHDIDGALARFRIGAHAQADLKQDVLTKLLARNGSLSSYSGLGDLGAWVRTVTTRHAISSRRKRVDGDPPIKALDAPVHDPETAFIKRRHSAQLVDAIRATVATLSAGDRTLLRQRFVEQLTLEQLALAHGLHRASVARRLARLRQTLARGVRSKLSVELRIEGGELEEAMRWARSHLEFSVRRLLSSTVDPEDSGHGV